MFQARSLSVAALLALLASAAVSADERFYYPDYGSGQYWSQPQVRLGVDVIWGGYGYAPPRPPVYWRPAYVYVPSYDYDHNHGRGHGRHRHHDHHWDDSDD